MKHNATAGLLHHPDYAGDEITLLDTSNEEGLFLSSVDEETFDILSENSETASITDIPVEAPEGTESLSLNLTETVEEQ